MAKKLIPKGQRHYKVPGKTASLIALESLLDLGLSFNENGKMSDSTNPLGDKEVVITPDPRTTYDILREQGKLKAPDMSDEQKASTTDVARDTLPPVMYQRFHEPVVSVQDGKIIKSEPSDAEVSWRKILAARADTRTEDEKERDRINQAIAKSLLELENDKAYKFAKTTGDVINETRHIVPAMLTATRIPFFFGVGSAWEGANLAYDAYHNDVPGMYRSVLEPAGFALFDAAVNPATWQFLGNAARRAGNYVYNRAINPVALWINRRFTKPASQWTGTITLTEAYPWVVSETPALEYVSPETRTMYFDYPNEPILTSDVPITESNELKWIPSLPANSETKMRLYGDLLTTDLITHPLKDPKFVTVGLDDTEENRLMLKNISDAYNDLLEYLKSPKMKEVAERLKEEAKLRNLDIDEFNPLAYIDDVKHIEVNNEFANDPYTGGLTYVTSEEDFPGIIILNNLYHQFKNNPYSVALHEDAHVFGLGMKSKSPNGSGTVVDFTPFLLKKVEDIYGTDDLVTEIMNKYNLDSADAAYVANYITKPPELIAFGILKGAEVGLKLGLEYPGKEEALKIIEDILKESLTRPVKYASDIMFEMIPINSEKDIKNVWDLLTGQYLYNLAPFIGLGIGAGMYNNYNKKQEKSNIH